ncbi:MAG: nuclear transport factor 2 family protein [Bacteroidia bacterium]|nr:MAG: nuclear transport factor 2 family protein [Bacteroidia bacterium]
MKDLTIIAISAFLMFSSCADDVIEKKESDTLEIREVLESFQEALKVADIETLKSLTTDDFLAFDSGQSMTIDDLEYGINAYIEMGLVDLKYSMEIIRSEIYADNALLIYKNIVTGKMDEREIEATWIGSCHYERIGEGWKIKYLHTTLPVYRGDTRR